MYILIGSVLKMVQHNIISEKLSMTCQFVTTDPKVFKLGIGNDLNVWVERSKVKARVRVNSNTAWV